MYTPIYRVQLVREGRQEVPKKLISSPDAAAAVLSTYLGDADRELFVLIGLTTKNHLIGITTVSMGSLESSVVHPREVFKPAILMNAACILVAHNHPSGEVDPSPEDRKVTERLVEAGEILGIEVLDHIVMGEGCHLSMKERGLM